MFSAGLCWRRIKISVEDTAKQRSQEYFPGTAVLKRREIKEYSGGYPSRFLRHQPSVTAEAVSSAPAVRGRPTPVEGFEQGFWQEGDGSVGAVDGGVADGFSDGPVDGSVDGAEEGSVDEAVEGAVDWLPDGAVEGSVDGLVEGSGA